MRVPPRPRAVIIAVHASGIARHLSVNQAFAATLARAGFASFTLDLLTPLETERHDFTVDTSELAERLETATMWVRLQPALMSLPLGYFSIGASVAPALCAAMHMRRDVDALVCCGGRPDAAGAELPGLTAATLLVVGGEDADALPAHGEMLDRLSSSHRMVIVPGAGPRFIEAGARSQLERAAVFWFRRYLTAHVRPGLLGRTMLPA